VRTTLEAAPIIDPPSSTHGQRRVLRAVLLGWVFVALVVKIFPLAAQPTVQTPRPGPARVFNVKDYGATGHKVDDARPCIQKAIDACSKAGGGVVVVPAGEYTSGTLHLRSHVRFQVERGATLLASPNPKDYDCGSVVSKAALLYGEELDDVSIVGRGIVDGQAQYEWRVDDFERAFDHKILMQALGKSLLRSVPKDYPKREIYPHLVWLGRCKDVHIADLNFLHSPSWSLTLYACERATFDGLYIYTSLKEAVWADGIDLDGCQQVSITNCAIETGDDCVALVSQNTWGPALTCQNISVTNCRLSSASAGVKFSEGNRAGISHIRVSDCLFNHVNRGFALNNTLGGTISDVELSNLTINCDRYDWFWAGDGQPFRFRITRLNELNQEPAKPDEPPPGSIRNVIIRNVVARAKGSSLFHGHPESWLDGLTLDNVKIFVSTDPTAPFDKAENALDFRRARNIALKNVEVHWDTPTLVAWKSALYLEDVSRLETYGFMGRQAWPQSDAPAVALKQVAGALFRNCRAFEGTDVFLKVTGPGSRDIRLEHNRLEESKVPCQLGPEVAPGAVTGLEPPSRK